MTNLRQAAQQALEFLSHDMVAEDWPHQKRKDAVCDALRAALAEPQTTHWEGCEAVHPECRKPEQEPDGISWLKRDSGYFTAPTPRKPLTDDEIVDIWAGVSMGYDDQINIIELGRAIERAHKIGVDE